MGGKANGGRGGACPGQLALRSPPHRSWLWAVLLLMAACLPLSATGGEGHSSNGNQRRNQDKGKKWEPRTQAAIETLPRAPNEAPTVEPQAMRQVLRLDTPDPATMTTAEPVAPESAEQVATTTAEPTAVAESIEASTLGIKQTDAATSEPEATVSEEFNQALTRASEAVDEVLSQHGPVVRGLGGVMRTLQRFKNSTREAAIEHVRQELTPTFCEAEYKVVVRAIRTMMESLLEAGLCSTFFHDLEPNPQWVAHCWTGSLQTYNQPATFVTPHAMLGWPQPAREARQGWDSIKLVALPLLKRRHLPHPVADMNTYTLQELQNKAKKAEALAEARRQFSQDFSKAMEDVERMRHEADKRLSAVDSEGAEMIYQEKVKEAESQRELMEKRADNHLESVTKDAELLLEKAKFLPPSMRENFIDFSLAMIAKAETEASASRATASASADEAIADAAATMQHTIEQTAAAAMRARKISYNQAQVAEDSARGVMDEAIARLEHGLVDALLPPITWQAPSPPEGAAGPATRAALPAVRAVATLDFGLPSPGLPANILRPTQPNFYFEAPPASTDLTSILGSESFQSQYLAFGYGLPYDAELCANALDSGDLCTYMCCQTRMLATASCSPSTGCY